MQRSLKILYLLVALSGLFASPTRAAVVVFTDPGAWQAAVSAVPTGHFHFQDFESFPSGGLSAGLNDFHPFRVDISGTSGFNAVDDSFTADPFSNAFSPNGSTYYLGDVGVNASEAPTLSFFDYPDKYQVIGFGADWVIQGDLFIEIQGTLISLSAYLPTGSGFLGIVTDQGEEILEANLSGTAVFGVDNIETGNVFIPIPAAAWLFASGLFGLIGVAGRKTTGSAL